jgi:hypothetical protein
MKTNARIEEKISFKTEKGLDMAKKNKEEEVYIEDGGNCQTN